MALSSEYQEAIKTICIIRSHKAVYGIEIPRFLETWDHIIALYDRMNESEKQAFDDYLN